jgi:ketopantoate reductase
VAVLTTAVVGVGAVGSVFAAARREPTWRMRLREVLGRLARGPAEAGSSILTDRLAGRRLEWEARNGVVQRLGLRHGIPTPVSDVIVPLLAACGPVPAT